MKTFLNGLKVTFLLFFSIFNLAQGQLHTPMKDRVALFNYDKSAAFDVKGIGSEKQGNVTVRDISFIGIPNDKRVNAFLVVPEGNGPFAGILWGHWLGHHTSNRNQYLEEAIELAHKGVASLLIDAMWSKPEWYENRKLSNDYDNTIKQVIEFRRAMDLLLSQKNIDKNRIAFVGHDYSGMYGSIAAGVEPQAKTYVFVAVTSSLYDWAFFSNQPESKVEYVRQNAVFELSDFVNRIEGSVFCQFSNRDPFISKTDGNLFYNAITSEVKEKKSYDAGHFMEGDDIKKDRKAWLIRELELK